MKKPRSLARWVFLTALIYLLGLVFVLFSPLLGDSVPKIVLPEHRDPSAVAADPEPTAEPRIFRELRANDPSTPLLLRAIPQRGNYHFSADLTRGGEKSALHIYLLRGCMRITLQTSDEAVYHYILLSDTVYSWREGDKKPHITRTEEPLAACGFGFLSLTPREGDQYSECSVDPYVIYPCISYTVIRAGSDLRETYSVSAETGCVFSYTARRESSVETEYRVETRFSSGAAEEDFRLPNGELPEFPYER